jgi:hypothetical protein
MVRHRTPKGRRRSRRTQKGGVESVLTRYPTLDALNAAIGTAVSKGRLAIPSQKRGICVTDAITASLWYSDYLGEWLWAHYIYGTSRRPGIDTAGVERGTLLRNDPVDSFMKLSALRVVNIMQQGAEVSVDRGVLARQPSAQPFRDLPTGEVCSNILAFMARDPLYSASDYFAEREFHGIRTEYTSEAAGRIVEAVLPRGSTVISADLCRDKTCVAVLINSSMHAVACVLVNNVWHFMDNEVGVAIPLRGITLEQIEAGSFSFTFDFTQADSMTYLLYLNSNAWRGGQLGSWTVNRKYTSGEYASGSTFPHQEDLSSRRYLCVNPRALQDDGAVHREVVETDVPMIEPAPRQKDLTDIVGDLAGVRFHPKQSSTRRSYITSESEDVVLRVSSMPGRGTYTLQVNGVTIGILTPNDRRSPTNNLWKVKFHPEGGQTLPGLLDLSGITPQNRGMMRIILTILNRQNQQTDVAMSDEESPAPPTTDVSLRPVRPTDPRKSYLFVGTSPSAIQKTTAIVIDRLPFVPTPGFLTPLSVNSRQVASLGAPSGVLWGEVHTNGQRYSGWLGDYTQTVGQALFKVAEAAPAPRLPQTAPPAPDLNEEGIRMALEEDGAPPPAPMYPPAPPIPQPILDRIADIRRIWFTTSLYRDVFPRQVYTDAAAFLTATPDATNAMLATAIRNSQNAYMKANPSGFKLNRGGRRTFRRRRSSLPKRTDPSSGRSRRYSRRRQASRS